MKIYKLGWLVNLCLVFNDQCSEAVVSIKCNIVKTIESIASTESKVSIHRKRGAQIEKRNRNSELSGSGKVDHIIVTFHSAKR